MTDSADWRAGHLSTTERAVWDALNSVPDPELGISIVALGLVRNVRAESGAVEIGLTYTSLGCPWTHFIQTAAREAAAAVVGVASVSIAEVWEESWTPADMSLTARRDLRRRGLPT